MAYLHGVETQIVTTGANPVTVVRSAVVGLVGIASKGAVNELTVVRNPTEAAQFGLEVPGFTIPQALSAIFAQGNTTVVVVNVYDPTTMITAVTAEAAVISGGKVKTAFAPIGSSFVLTNAAGSTTYVRNTDYSVDEFGTIKVLNFASIAEGSTVKATYNKLDAAAVTSSVVIGTINGTTNVKTGHKLYSECLSTLGYEPKILISPTYCEIAAVATEMISQANTLRAVCIIDAPTGNTPAEISTARGPGGTVPGFNSTSDRVILTYPRMKAFDAYSNADQLRPYSQFMAGVMCATDLNPSKGYWYSSSNTPILGVTGVERRLTESLNDTTSQTNVLNEIGVCTVIMTGGVRTWGNRSAAWPSTTAPNNFIAVRRTADIIHISVEEAMRPFLGQPINQAIIDSIRETVNGFLRTLKTRGAIIDGVCKYIPENNPPTELALGHLTFDLDFLPPSSLERITFKSFLNIEYFNALA